MWREKETVGPCGKWDSVRAVGTPLCSWRRTMSERPDACAEEMRLGRIRFPLLSRMDVGRSSRISFANDDSLVEGSREVVTNTLGSTIPDN